MTRAYRYFEGRHDPWPACLYRMFDNLSSLVPLPQKPSYCSICNPRCACNVFISHSTERHHQNKFFLLLWDEAKVPSWHDVELVARLSVVQLRVLGQARVKPKRQVHCSSCNRSPHDVIFPKRVCLDAHCHTSDFSKRPSVLPLAVTRR